MEDKRASLVAAAFGSVAIGGFWLARPIVGATPLKVVEQWTPVVRQSNEADLAVGFRIENPPRVLAARESGLPIEYRILDQSGKGFPLFPLTDGARSDALKLPRGYTHALESPRLAAFANGELIATTPIDPLPGPEQIPLLPRPNSDISLSYRPGGGIYAEAKRPIRDDERLRIIAHRTPHNAELSASATLGPKPTATIPAAYPYPMRRTPTLWRWTSFVIDSSPEAKSFVFQI